MKVSKTRMICEAAIFIAMAEILSLIKLYEFPNGGSITLEMLPIILFAARYGCGWGSLAGLVYGTITYLIGNKFSIDWTTIICDYFLAFVALGFGAGLLSRRKWSVYYGTLIGGVLRFLVHFLIGVFVWGKWMPDTFLGKPMTSPWIYSLIYNGSYMLPSIILCLVVFALAIIWGLALGGAKEYGRLLRDSGYNVDYGTKYGSGAAILNFGIYGLVWSAKWA